MNAQESPHAVAARPLRRFWNVPNTLTTSRLALAICVFALVDYEQYAWALAVFILAAVTDALDGYFARLLNQDTPIGRQLDPLIDKVIVSGCYIYLATIQGTDVMPWMVTAIVVREMLIQGLRSHLEGRGQPFGARTAGKLKTVVQCLSIGAVLLSLSFERRAPEALILLRDALTWLAVGLTLYSGLVYVKVAWPKLRGEG
ncbi:MAG: CDP-diacylglycerol--glycerol-3-phosphate 3-phosphatidyltransferase [Isosphaeraceae bacterium]